VQEIHRSKHIAALYLMEAEVEFWAESHRRLLSSGATGAVLNGIPKWKTALWEANAIEPAMLRAPFIIILFLFLWGINTAIFEKARLQYYMTLNIKNSKPFKSCMHK
jgi:hypothetical protein